MATTMNLFFGRQCRSSRDDEDDDEEEENVSCVGKCEQLRRCGDGVVG
jgi:hypothetical protein